jgi:hypothetical protein
MKTLPLFLIGILGIFIFTSTGCRKLMCCSAGIGYVTCTKGTDSISIFGSTWSTYSVADTINFYQNQGYSCSATINPLWNATRVFGVINIKKVEKGGEYCADPSFFGAGYDDCPYP